MTTIRRLLAWLGHPDHAAPILVGSGVLIAGLLSLIALAYTL